MNSDYIPRLRSELLRAGATKQTRWRAARVARGLRPVAVAAAVTVLAVAGVLALSDGGGDETPVGSGDTLRLTYRTEPSGTPATEQAARVMRARLAAAGVTDARVSAAATGLSITVPATARAEMAALGQTGRLSIYDWERSVLGPRGTDAVSKAEAESRAAGRPGARVLRAPSVAPDGWFALGGDPALTNADVDRASAATDPQTLEPVVAIEFTASGRAAFEALTRDLARRGEEQAAGGPGGLEAAQHFAIVLDDRVVAVPFIDFRQAPDGIDGAAGTHISGGLTPVSARRVAALLSAGPLDAKLVLESEDPVGG
jgi:preprotein translocase subunit SecD